MNASKEIDRLLMKLIQHCYRAGCISICVKRNGYVCGAKLKTIKEIEDLIKKAVE